MWGPPPPPPPGLHGITEARPEDRADFDQDNELKSISQLGLAVQLDFDEFLERQRQFLAVCSNSAQLSLARPLLSTRDSYRAKIMPENNRRGPYYRQIQADRGNTLRENFGTTESLQGQVQRNSSTYMDLHPL